MKTLAKAASKLSNPLAQHLHCSSLAAILAVVLIASARPAAAKVVYTPVNVTITGNGSIDMRLNQDGLDFRIQASGHQIQCCAIDCGGLGVDVTIFPTTGNGIVVRYSDFAELFHRVVQINSRANFYKATAVISQEALCFGRVDKASGYLGLEFQINGKTHYGWALVNVFARWGGVFHPNDMETTLIGFAYETIPGSPINIGQTSGPAADPGAADPGSTNPEDSGSGPTAPEYPDPGTLTVFDLFSAG